MENLLERTGQCQRVLEQVLHTDMSNAEIVSNTLKVSSQHYLPIKCFDILEHWALRTYGK